MTIVADVADRIVPHRHEAIELPAVIDLARQPERGERPIDDVEHDDHEARLARLADEVDLLEQR